MLAERAHTVITPPTITRITNWKTLGIIEKLKLVKMSKQIEIKKNDGETL
jgi:hypothetical protein